MMVAANGWRYPLVGETRQRHFAGTNSKPRELPDNAQTPTSRVHAVLARLGRAARTQLALAFAKSSRWHSRSLYSDQGSTLALYALAAFDLRIADFFGITRR